MSTLFRLLSSKLPLSKQCKVSDLRYCLLCSGFSHVNCKCQSSAKSRTSGNVYVVHASLMLIAVVKAVQNLRPQAMSTLFRLLSG